MRPRGHCHIGATVKVEDAPGSRRVAQRGRLDPFTDQWRVMPGAYSPARRELCPERHSSGEGARRHNVLVAPRPGLDPATQRPAQYEILHAHAWLSNKEICQPGTLCARTGGACVLAYPGTRDGQTCGKPGIRCANMVRDPIPAFGYGYGAPPTTLFVRPGRSLIGHFPCLVRLQALTRA